MPVATKTELFDVDVLQKLVIKDGIAQKDKADLQRYRRRRINGNEVLIAYDFGKDYKDLQFGRLYPKPHIGLTAFPKDIRAALAQKYYWDIDIENAQPNLFVVLAKRFAVLCPGLQEYCDNRDSVLEEIIATSEFNREEAKTSCLAVLFGGYREDHPLLPLIYSELKELSLKVASEYPKLYALCKSQGSLNPYASCLSLFIQNEERLVLQCIDESLHSLNRSMDVLIFDGGLVRKLQNETEFPTTVLRSVEAMVFDKTGYSIRLVNKPLTHTFDFIKHQTLIPADTMIDDLFACKKFIELNPGVFMRDGNETFMVNPSTGLWAKTTFLDFNEVLSSCFSEMIFKQDSGSGIRSFNYGGNLKNIKNMFEFLPICSPKGQVPIEFIGSLGESPSNPEIITLYLELLSILAKHNQEMIQYLIHYLAHTLQKPRDLPGVCLVITGDQGCGKDTTFDIFMKYVIGSFYTATMKNEVFFSPYDDLKARKVMVRLEEANAKFCSDNSDALKNLITGNTVSFNPKHKSPFEAENFCRYIFTTNSGNPIAIEGLDRRYVFFNASNEKVGNAEFWSHIYTILGNDEAGRVLYSYFMSLDISHFNPRVFPISEYQEEVREEYKSIERQFIDQWDGNEVSADELHRLYSQFCKRMKLADDHIPNKLSFGKKLLLFLRDNHIEKKRRNDGIYYSKPMI